MTVRTRLLNAIVAAVGAVPNVGAVIRPGLTPEGLEEAVVAQTRGGKFAVEVLVAHDDPEGDASDTLTVQRWELPIGLYVHLPSPLPLRSPDGPERLSADEVASDIHAALYLLYMGPDTDPGRWVDADGPTARSTHPLGGGGVYIDDRMGTEVTEHAFVVHYAHQATDPSVTA